MPPIVCGEQRLAARLCGALLLLCCASSTSAADPNEALAALAKSFAPEVRPLLERHCQDCHSGDRMEAEIDLASFATIDDVRRKPRVWQQVAEMLDSGQMPPPDAPQPSDEERTRLRTWVRRFLTEEARAQAGDPGRVVLRRLSNAEYTHTVRDLTGVETLDPAREFPIDGAAGEGFTNTGAALVMSPALVTKYFDAGKEIASHAVLLPGGLRFSPHTTRRDWTDDGLAAIRAFYGRFSDESGGTAVNLQGIQFDTNRGGRLPVERYLAATLAEREKLRSGAKTTAQVAAERSLSPRYLDLLWRALNEEPSSPSPPLDALRAQWREATPEQAPALAVEIARWQQSLWKFNPVGHIGREGGPQSWQEAVTPLVGRQEFKTPLPANAAGQEVVLYLVADDAGDGAEHDFVVWERPRLVAPGRPDLLLRDLRPVIHALATRRQQLFASSARCLAAAAEAGAATGELDIEGLAKRHQVEPAALGAWLEYLGIAAGGPVRLGAPLERKIERAEAYDFIKGWVGDDALSVVANSSDQHVRIPGNMRPHSVAVHPSPTLSVAVGWRSPAAATLRLEGMVQHAHPECGNGVAWSLELRRGNTRQRLATGVSQRAAEVKVGPLEQVAVRAGDVISLVISPQDNNHSCDLTAIDLTIHDGQQEWNLWRELSPDLLAGNPHADSHGNRDVWHFYSEPAGAQTGHVIPAGSLLARWQASGNAAERTQLAEQLQRLLEQGPAGLADDSADVSLHRQLTSLGGPLLSAALRGIAVDAGPSTDDNDSQFALPPSAFGRHPAGGEVDAGSLCVQAPSVVELRLPADLVAGTEFVTTGTLHAGSGDAGSVQLRVLTERPAPRGLDPATPIMVRDASDAGARIEGALDRFRQLFPAALCYTKIVPVDEVVTLTLYYREDEQLRRLMLDDQQAAELDRLWDELLYVSQAPLASVAALEQIIEFATQDRGDLVPVFEALRAPTNARAEAFRQRMVDAEPAQLDALLALAPLAYRRPLADDEVAQLRELYATLRVEELPHEEALRLTLARMLIAPAFLYKIERPGPGAEQGPINDWELASRLSYFLWSSAPDAELRRLAAEGRLRDPEIVAAQTRRMLADPKARRLATEFACQWLHIHGFDSLDEKSEQVFPTFNALRGAMYEESIRFFTDLFQHDGTVLSILDADHTFLNGQLAQHYGIPGVEGEEWRRVDGVRQFGRGGVLTQATTLAKQSGASRTSPILRGNWLSEVVLGEKLPRPPKNVPQLADTVPQGLTERQLIERHSSDPSCAKCHARIDPFGFSLENYDAIGRFRERDAAGLPIDTRTRLPDGTALNGVDDLRSYLLTTRREAFLRQFLRKLLGYSLGRAVQLSDEPLLDEMRAALDQHEGRVGAVIDVIVRSRPFREIRGREVAFE